VGITLSEAQAAVANRAAVQRGTATRVRALVCSYDNPPDGPFDVIVAIESLAHSPDPARSVGALARVLAPGGAFIVVDDMPASAAASADLDTFKRGWNCPVLWSKDRYIDAFRREGLGIDSDVDLTSDCDLRPSWWIGMLSNLNRTARAVSPLQTKLVLDAHLGGLALERLLARRDVRYQLIVARRPELQVS
jgi:SAM-dependent methyltransferase